MSASPFFQLAPCPPTNLPKGPERRQTTDHDPGDEDDSASHPPWMRWRFRYGEVLSYYPRKLFWKPAEALPDHDAGDEEPRWEPMTFEESMTSS